MRTLDVASLSHVECRDDVVSLSEFVFITEAQNFVTSLASRLGSVHMVVLPQQVELKVVNYCIFCHAAAVLHRRHAVTPKSADFYRAWRLGARWKRPRGLALPSGRAKKARLRSAESNRVFKQEVTAVAYVWPRCSLTDNNDQFTSVIIERSTEQYEAGCALTKHANCRKQQKSCSAAFLQAFCREADREAEGFVARRSIRSKGALCFMDMSKHASIYCIYVSGHCKMKSGTFDPLRSAHRALCAPAS